MLPCIKEVESRLSAVETKMFRWMAGVTRLDRICNEGIRNRFSVAAIIDKFCESRLRWYFHDLRAEEGTVCKVGLDLEVPGKRPKGQPMQRWLDTLQADLNLAGIHLDQGQDRVKLRQQTSKADPATKRQTLKKKN